MYWLIWVAIQGALFVLAELLRPKPNIENAKPASLGDFQFPTATEDRVIPLLWGTCRQKGPNVVWYGDFRQVPIKKTIKTGLFTKETQIRGYRYYLGVQFALCRGAGDATDDEQVILTRCWIGDTEVFSSTSIVSAAPLAAGTGYFRNQVLTLTGGTFTRPATVKVLETGLTGDVTRLRMKDRGEYSVFPGGASTTTTGGTGTGATVTFVKGAEVEHGDELVVDCPDLLGGEELGQGGVSGTLTLFSGTDDQSASPYLSSGNSAVSATVGAGGTGYALGDILTLVGGTFGSAAKMLVTAIGIGGVVTAVTVIDRGFYTAFPSLPAATTVQPTGGSGCTLNIVGGVGFQSINGVTPRYLRTCYLAPSVDPLYLGNSTSIRPWSFEVRRIPNPLALGAHALVNGADANPANVLVEILQNREWGLRQTIASVDAVSFADAGETLFDEGNGFSLLLDRKMQGSELIRLIEEQVDGVVFFNMLLGKWQINLVRGGYDVNTLPLLSTANILELESFARGSWEDTTNQVAVKFADRKDGYKQTSALAQDQANIRTLQGRVVSAEPSYPGCKDRDLANSLSWRDLRGLSYPLAKASVYANRSVFDAQPGAVYAWTYEIGGESFVRMPMRVTEVDYGQLDNGRIRLGLVEDVFQTAAGSFSSPGDTNWEPPSDDLEPLAYQIAMEAPRAITLRDPEGGGPDRDLLWCAGRRRGPEVGFEIAERHAAGTPAGPFAPVGRVFAAMLVGHLSTSLARGSAVPLATLTLVPGPDSQSALEVAVTDTSDPVELGTDLVNLIAIGDGPGREFALVSAATPSGGNVSLTGVYRGSLDSVQGSWPAGTPVYLLSAGAGLSDSSVPAGQNVDVVLLPFSTTDQVSDDAATIVPLAMSNRVRRPYPPSRISLDGTAWATTTSLEANGSVPEDFALDVSDLRRRDYRTVDEAAALGVDASAIFADFPAANSTQHKIDVRDNPSGANTLLFTTALFSGTQKDVRRIEILKATDGVIPTSMRLDAFARHTHESVAYDSLSPLRHDFAVTSALTGRFNHGARAANVSSNAFTVTTIGVVNLTLSSAFTAGSVEYEVNASGIWLPVITAGNTVGATAALAVTDTVRYRHTSTDVLALKQLTVDNPGASQDGYMILFT